MIHLIRDIHSAARPAGRPAISFEFFPPKTDKGVETFFGSELPALLGVNPEYCSVTYGAGGGTRETTLDMVERIQREHQLTTMMHLTCVNHTRAELAQIIQEAGQRGVRNLLALRGDQPGGGEFVKTEGGFMQAAELVAFIRETGGFDIGVAGFPEGHIHCKDGREKDWGFLVEKINAGASFVVTQLFFDNADYFAFREYLTRMGVTVPLIPGLLPITSKSQTGKFIEMCGAKLPKPFLDTLEALGDDNEAVTRFGIEYCTEQCAELLREGAPGIHFYTLNKARSAVEIVRNL